jgi:ATP-dependent Lon protease
MGKQDPLELSSPTAMLIAPILPLRDVVVYPHMVIPLFVGREKSIRPSMRPCGRQADHPGGAEERRDRRSRHRDLYRVGTLANILQCSSCPMAP